MLTILVSLNRCIILAKTLYTYLNYTKTFYNTSYKNNIFIMHI